MTVSPGTLLFEDINGLDDADWDQFGAPVKFPLDLAGNAGFESDASNDGLANTNGYPSDGNKTVSLGCMIFVPTSHTGTTDLMTQVKVNSGNLTMVLCITDGLADLSLHGNGLGGNRLRSISSQAVARDEWVHLLGRGDGAAGTDDNDLFLNGTEASGYSLQDQILGSGFDLGVVQIDQRLALLSRWNNTSTTIIQTTNDVIIARPKLWSSRLSNADILEEATNELAIGDGSPKGSQRAIALRADRRVRMGGAPQRYV